MSLPDVTVIIRYRCQPGQAATALAKLSALVATVRREEPDCHGITIVQNEDDACDFTLIEAWSSREAYAGPHLLTPHLTAFKDIAPQFMAGPPQITYWREACRV